MTARVVVHLRWRPLATPDGDAPEEQRGWSEVAGPLFERASALGGRVVAWGHEFLTVDFAWDGLYDAIDLLVDGPLAPELSVGVGWGEVDAVYTHSRVALGVGPTLPRVAQLAEVARPGEVLIAPELHELAGERLGVSGEVGKRPGRPEIAAFVLDPSRPFGDLEVEVPPSSLPARFTSEPPTSFREREVARLASAAEIVESNHLFPAAFGRALEHRDAASLRELAESAREGESSELADRLDALAELASGKSGDALRRLRHAKLEALGKDGSERCRASLALAVALLAAGRPHEAVLEALEALARARESQDARGEKASTRLLARLGAALGDEPSAEAWARASAE